MLATPDSSISQIAHQLGYTDPAHFTRGFMAWKGRRRGHGGLPAPLSRVTQQGCDRHRINPELSASSVAIIVGGQTRRRMCAYGAIV